MEGNHMILDELIRQELDKRIGRAQLVWRLRNSRSQGGPGMAAALKRVVGSARRVLSAKRERPVSTQVRELTSP